MSSRWAVNPRKSPPDQGGWCCPRHQPQEQEGTYLVKPSKQRPPLKVTADGKGVVSHAGSRLLAEMADASGLTDALSEAMAPICKRARRHDPGRVLVDLAVTLRDGGDALSDLVTLRNQPGVFGAVASVPTAFRVVDSVDGPLLARIRAARASARAAVWGAGLNPVTEHGYVILDFDASLLDAHSDKQRAAPTYKKGTFPSGSGWTTRRRPWPPSCAPATRAPTPQPITSPSWSWPWSSCRSSPRGSIPVDGVAMLARADS